MSETLTNKQYKVCVYCQENPANVDEHVFPRSWYPATTPMTMEKWQVPACRSCNGGFSANEQYALSRLILTIDPDSPAASGVIEGVLRSFNSNAGKSKKDKAARERARKSLDRTLAKNVILPAQTVRNVLQTTLVNEGPVMFVDMARIESVFCKFVIGAHAYLEKQPLPQKAKIDIRFSHRPEQLAELSKLAQSHDNHCLGPGITVRRMLISDDNGNCDSYIFMLWQSVFVYGLAYWH